jgi:hypothetical protein
MRGRIRAHLTYANVMATTAVFIALGGVAYAVDTVGSADVINNSLRSADLKDDAAVQSVDVRDDTLSNGGLAAADLKPDSVGTSEAADNSLTGNDIDESSLGQVPSAALGGLGRQSGANVPCDPESLNAVTCSPAGAINLPAPSRVLILGEIRAEPDTGGGNGGGNCWVVSNLGGQEALEPVFVNGGQTDVMPISAVTPVVGPGSFSFFIYCNETASGIRYWNGHVSAVALSPG